MAKVKKKKVKKVKKVFELLWVCEDFESHNSFYTKRMFGGLAVYLHGKMVLVLVENPGDKSYRDKVYKFDIWHGLLFPTDYEHQESLCQDFPDLIQHPVLKKWLFLKYKDKNFEQVALACAERIKRKDKRFGIFPKMG